MKMSAFGFGELLELEWSILMTYCSYVLKIILESGHLKVNTLYYSLQSWGKLVHN